MKRWMTWRYLIFGALLMDGHQAYDRIYQQARIALFGIAAFFEGYQDGVNRNGDRNDVPHSTRLTQAIRFNRAIYRFGRPCKEDLIINILILEAFGSRINRPDEGNNSDNHSFCYRLYRLGYYCRTIQGITVYKCWLMVYGHRSGE